MPRRIVFLESRHGVESLLTRGLRGGAAARGWQAEVDFLRRPDGSHETLPALRARLRAARPDALAFLMDAPLEWDGLFDDPALAALPKLSFWFDDFVRSLLTMERPEVWRRWQAEQNVAVFIHDGHWREAWARHTGHAALPVDLAADPETFPGVEVPPTYPELAVHAVMLGTIPAAASLEADLAAFSPSVRRWLAATAEALEAAPWPLRPYDLAEAVLPALHAKDRLLVEQLRRDPRSWGLAINQLWRAGKRAARLRGLRALAERVPVAVLSGHRREPFAREEELRAALPPGARLAFRDTTEIPSSAWAGLFRSGALHVQWVDPQSIESGAPWRMFETAAAGTALLSDARPGFPALFAPDREMYYAPDEKALAARAAALLAGPAEALHATAQNARAAFLTRHTWAERWKQIEERIA